jgi:hypothetical protein
VRQRETERDRERQRDRDRDRVRQRETKFDFDSTGEFIKFDKFGDYRLDPFRQNKYVFLY